ncbi:NAD(P)H:quinone oxidoreductase [Flavobacterium sp. '19STA2R22 D10 B1']|uniref:NAD(P)H:quinone oxidoreductase n=1 Tax=Flavobacterium aerium TaxID=3037261 RepID=UPI00278BFFBF|nr:NAD(P)H:quinone oxidoreductase [Flavobacterium sp. '19STA2R22 D10 B1']
MKKSIQYSLVLILSIFMQMNALAMNDTGKTRVLVLFTSQNGGTYKMALAVAEGINSYPNTEAVIKQIPLIKPVKVTGKDFEKCPVATIEELPTYDGIAFGSPVNFANISADMHYFFNQTIDLWTSRKLEGMPATVFMSAGSGAGKEAAILSFWNMLALHGMVIVPTGLMATETIDKTVPQGNTPFGASSIGGAGGKRPSDSELNVARAQGKALAKIANALHTVDKETVKTDSVKKETTFDVNEQLKKLKIELPVAPMPVGNYVPYVISDNKVYINQVALLNGKILNPGRVGDEVTDQQAKEATYQTMLNVIAVLKVATNGDLNKVKRVVQLTGFFYTNSGYKTHAALMNSASDLAVNVFGDKGKHARATVGAVSLPLDSPVEIQAIFELE